WSSPSLRSCCWSVSPGLASSSSVNRAERAASGLNRPPPLRHRRRGFSCRDAAQTSLIDSTRAAMAPHSKRFGQDRQQRPVVLTFEITQGREDLGLPTLRHDIAGGNAE